MEDRAGSRRNNHRHEAACDNGNADEIIAGVLEVWDDPEQTNEP